MVPDYARPECWTLGFPSKCFSFILSFFFVPRVLDDCLLGSETSGSAKKLRLVVVMRVVCSRLPGTSSSSTALTYAVATLEWKVT
jgi:hypothetical protein